MDWTLEVVVLPVSDIDASITFYRDRVGECSETMVFSPDDGGTFLGFSGPDGNTWAVQQLKVRGDTPLIPLEHRRRFGAQPDV